MLLFAFNHTQLFLRIIIIRIFFFILYLAFNLFIFLRIDRKILKMKFFLCNVYSIKEAYRFIIFSWRIFFLWHEILYSWYQNLCLHGSIWKKDKPIGILKMFQANFLCLGTIFSNQSIKIWNYLAFTFTLIIFQLTDGTFAKFVFLKIINSPYNKHLHAVARKNS